MEKLYNKFGLESYNMILVEGEGEDDNSLYCLGDNWFIHWNGFEYERLIETTERFLANPQPYREASFIEGNLWGVAKGITFATGYKRLTRIDDELFGISLPGDLIRIDDELFGVSLVGYLTPLDIPIEVVERFKANFIYDLRQGLVFSEVKELVETDQLQN